jgi:hypothetical protein
MDAHNPSQGKLAGIAEIAAINITWCSVLPGSRQDSGPEHGSCLAGFGSSTPFF